MISIKQIHYALAVERHLHFKRAADDCSISQSTLSSALSELEKLLGLQIFERDNKKVLITPLGKQFLERARRIKHEVDALYLLNEAHKKPLSHPMTIGVIPTIGPYLLPKVLPALRKRYPDFKLTLIEDQSQVLIEKVRTGDIDTAILALPYATEGLLTFDFWQENFYWATSDEHKAGTKHQISSAEIDRSELMLLKEGHCLKDHALAACQLGTSDTHHTVEATSLNTLIQMVAGKMGSTLVPELAIDQLTQQASDLHLVPLAEPGPHRVISFIVRPNYASTHNIEALCEIFSKELKTRLES